MKRIHQKLRAEGDCLCWPYDNPMTKYKGRYRAPRVLIWEEKNGPLYGHLEATCGNRWCCKLEHLRLKTAQTSYEKRKLSNKAWRLKNRGKDPHRSEYGNKAVKASLTLADCPHEVVRRFPHHPHMGSCVCSRTVMRVEGKWQPCGMGKDVYQDVSPFDMEARNPFESEKT